MLKVKLNDGTEVVFDFYKVPYKEMMEWLKVKKKTDDHIYKMMAKVTGKSEESLSAWLDTLPYPDTVKIHATFYKGVTDPNAGGSSVSESTGE